MCLEEIGGTIINSNFIENASGGYAGALAYMPIFSGTPLTLDNATFINNSAVGSAGAVYARPRWPVTITNTIFINNSASEAGAVQLYNRITLTVINCSFTDNKAIVGPRQRIILQIVEEVQLLQEVRCGVSGATSQEMQPIQMEELFPCKMISIQRNVLLRTTVPLQEVVVLSMVPEDRQLC